MANLKCIIVWLVFLLAHLNLELVQCFSYKITRCPPSLSSDCPPNPVNSCSNDQDCEARYPGKGLKCCKGCGSSCVSPKVSVVEVTPAKMYEKLKILTKLVLKCPTSPPSWQNPSASDQECQDDASCDKKFPGQGLKCCSDGNDFGCFPPVVESVKLPLYCPIFPPTQGWKIDDGCDGKYYENECFIDVHCKEKYPVLKSFVKCCLVNCINKKCTIRQVQGEKPTGKYLDKKRLYKVFGTCPIMPTTAECPPKPHDECIDDSDCKHLGYSLKCCKDGCSFRCVPPVTPTVNGTCPIFPLADECPPKPDDECKNDLECTISHHGLPLKCCKDGCDFNCVPPVTPTV